MNVSLIVPTKNRPDMLLRLIKYYRELGFRGKILIGDSSDKGISVQIAQSLSENFSKIDCQHYYLPDTPFGPAMNFLNKKIKTHYVAYVADDDFLIPGAIEACIAFLDTHPDYVAAHGIGALIGSRSGENTDIQSAGYYRQPIVEQDSAVGRFRSLFESYSVSLFSIHRADTWRRIFRDTPDPMVSPGHADLSFGGELLQSSLSAVYGKIGQIDKLYLIRQAHNSRYLLPSSVSWFDWITKQDWRDSYLYFRDHVARAISETDGIPLIQSEQHVGHSFSNYLRQLIASAEAKPSRIREFTRESKRLRTLRSLWRVVLAGLRPTFITLENLKSPTSPYYTDFLPIHRAVTEPESLSGLACDRSG